MVPVSQKRWQHNQWQCTSANPGFGLRAAIDYLFSIYEFQQEFAADIGRYPEP
jgi:hypothetical protein